MVSIHVAIQKSPVLAKRYRYIAIGLLLGLCLFYLFRSCTLDSFSQIIYIGQDPEWHELNLMGKDRNLSAFNKDLLMAIAKQENFHARLVVNSDPVKDLEQEKLQGILTTMKPNYLNENRFLFSEPYFRTGPVLIIPSSVAENKWNEKRKRIVAIQKQSHLISTLEQDPSIQIKFYDDILSALADLSERRIDGAIFPAIPAYTYTHTFYKHELKIATLPLTDDGVRFVTLKNDAGQSLIKKFNDGLQTLKQDGTYQKLIERWGLIHIEDNFS